MEQMDWRQNSANHRKCPLCGSWMDRLHGTIASAPFAAPWATERHAKGELIRSYKQGYFWACEACEWAEECRGPKRRDC